MALTTNREVDHYIDQELRSVQVAANQRVFKGSFVGAATSGYAQPLAAGDPFIGLAYEESDNTGGGDGAESVRVYTQGDFGMTLSGAAIADIGRPVFASADDTLTFTATSNSWVGLVEDVVSAGEIILRIDPAHQPVKTVVHAVADLGAGSDIAARAVHAFDQSAWVVAVRIVNQATSAAGIDNSNTCVVTVATSAGTVASKTFNATTPFPAANAMSDLGNVSNAHGAAGTVMTLAVTNGTTANPGPFIVEVDYV